jgi:hypothetical protein
MRLILAACAAIFMTLAGVRCAFAAPTTSLDMRADRVAYYSNRYVVTGEGHVHIRLSDGTILTSEIFSMDLKLNRFLLAGDVHIDGGNVHEVGAAFAGYPDLDRSYFLSAHGDPDKWTYFGLDFAHPQKGRAQPGDAYFIPDLSDQKPYIIASTAIILPNINVKFGGARVSILSGLGVYVPTGSWVQTFSANPNYAQNAFSGATFDIGLPYQGSAHAISALHLRYTGMNKFFLSFDQHFVWGRDYVVFSINPLTNEERQFNLIAYKRISPKMEIRLFTQESTAQHGIIQPEVASAYENLQYNVSKGRSSFSLNADNYNTSLLLYPEKSTLDDQRAYDHPSDGQLAWTYADTAVGKYIPLLFRVRAGDGLAHDGYHCGRPIALSGCDESPDIGYVLDYFGTARTRVPTIWQHFIGATLYNQTLPLARTGLNLNVVLDKQRQWFSLPHHIDTTNTTISVSKLYTRKLAFLGAFTVTQLGDYYGARQLEFYPPDDPQYPTPGGPFFPGYEAFRGFSTTRQVTGSAIVTPNQYFNYAFTLRHNDDFPAPIPGLFGNAPFSMTNEFRFRLTKQILVDISRTDYFNFGGYTPQFNVQFGP